MLILIIVFFLSFIEEGVLRRVLTGAISFIFIIWSASYLEKYYGPNEPKYKINDKVQLPDNILGAT
jgi:hypothetical protein